MCHLTTPVKAMKPNEIRTGDRKRQKIASLEAQAKGSSHSPRLSDSSDENQSPQPTLDILGDLDPIGNFNTSDSTSNGGSAECASEGGLSLEHDNLLSFPDKALADLSQSDFDFNDTADPLNFFSNSMLPI